jgi:hypothetical protein
MTRVTVSIPLTFGLRPTQLKMDGFSEKISRDNIHPVTYVKNLVVGKL